MNLTSRKKILDTLANVFKEPEKHGDRFLVHIVKNAKGKAIPVNLLHDMTRDLYNVPLDYLIHCISSDTRFMLNSKKTAVCLAVPPTETDPHGFINNDPGEGQSTMKINKNEEAWNTMYYKPLLSEIWTEDLQPKQKVFPVVFENGKFYVDDEPESCNDYYQCFVSIPDYEAENINPLGIEQNIILSSEICFNCDQEGHGYNDCPEPLNREVVKARRIAKTIESNVKGRIFAELELINNVNKMEPGKLSKNLKDALGMENENDEPPYYKNMRVHGYPPGYWRKAPSNQSSAEHRFSIIHSDNILYSSAPLLKIYNDDIDIEDATEKEPEKHSILTKDSVTENNYVQLVHYPGLTFIDFSKYDHYANNQQSLQFINHATPEENLYYQHVYYQQYYYPFKHLSLPDSNQQSIYPSESTYYPHTLQADDLHNQTPQFRYSPHDIQCNSVDQTSTEQVIVNGVRPSATALDKNNDEEDVDMDISSGEE
ncbi:hypothetical protein G6F60_003430 [Rhizopus arrhizus]|nr:hypothetical protein G6F60_003430 [Rhizopus arrhizus]